jgi:pimeloyl-ACP methyl ester carboxylesterase
MLPLADLLDVDVVIPSLPGFLFSELVEGPMTRAAIAEAFHVLMTESLGYERYFLFGGDIGGAASGWLATMHPRSVAGLHVIHGPFPADFDASPVTAEEQAFLDAEEARDEVDSGYSWIMGTRPDTIAAALADSPAGLAAWIIDKLDAWIDPAGDLESRFDRDTLCTVLTLYWVTESIGTSFRQYLDWPKNGPRPTITVPVAVTRSHEAGMELFPRSIAERAATDIRQYSTPDRGGHFLAFEEPRLIADELGAFMRSVG